MFCRKCGNEILPQSKFCSKCGFPVNTPTYEPPKQNGTGDFSLTINRAKQWFAVNPAIKVVVDGKGEYKIENGSTIKLPVSAGVHNVAFSCNIRNKIVDINVTDNVVLDIKWNRVTGSLEVK